MRGKVSPKTPFSCLNGITPAYAGKRLPDTERGRATRDHPRLCGEKFLTVDKTPLVLGSPPPMRGKGLGTMRYAYSTGITPAYAGKSSGLRWVITISQDHPRLCGEKYTCARESSQTPGSPPPMRGKAAFVAFNIVTMRITPAYAGKRNDSFF